MIVGCQDHPQRYDHAREFPRARLVLHISGRDADVVRGMTSDRSSRQNPYVGPRPFAAPDNDVFFGRSGEVRVLASLIVANRVSLLYSPAGAGKTSLLNAGLIPTLQREEQFDVLPLARVLRPGGGHASTPAGNVYAQNVCLNWIDALPMAGGHQAGTIPAFLRKRAHPLGADGLPAPRVVFFDQFEEFFTLGPQHWRDRAPFFEQINAALADDDLLRVVLVMRGEYLAQLDSYRPLLPGGLRARVRLEHLDPDAALVAVTGPALRAGRCFAPAAAEHLVEDLLRVRVERAGGTTIDIEGEFVEPLQLQLRCQALWADLPPDVVTINDDHLRAFAHVVPVSAHS